MSYKLSSYSNRSFAFDVGTNSIGWCVFDLDETRQPVKIRDIGVRIFSDGRDPKSKTSLAVARREARAMSRSRDRYLRRRKKTLSVLTEYGLMPADDAERKRLLAETVDHPAGADAPKTHPYDLRSRALTEKLPLTHTGRALFHLGQRRGFKSNRKTDKKSNEKGKIAVGIEELKAQIHIAGAPTLGAYLAMRRAQGHVVRIRSGSEAFNEADYAFYPERFMLEDEFRKIWDAQSVFYPDILTDERREHLFRVIFYQRPLKAPAVGRCSFNKHETRIAKAHPLFQEFRLYKEVNELGLRMPDISIRKLTKEQRDTLVQLLRPKKKVTFSTLRKALKLPADITFNKETDNRKDIAGDEIYATMSDKKLFGPQWAAFSQEKQWDIIYHLREDEDPQELEKWLHDHFQLDDEQITAILDARLPEGHGRLGPKALVEMLEELKLDVIPESEAAKRCGYDHALLDKGEGLDKLPPYQEVLERHIPPGTGNPDDIYDIQKGRITNPTVHIGLNQLRKVINALLRKHGKPIEMAIELARDLQRSEKQKKTDNDEIGKNTRAAQKRSEKLKELGQHDNGYNRQLLKLWEELNEKPENRVCIYSGKPISVEMLFSGDVDIDHILPWSRTLDDSAGNKLLCLKAANRMKCNRTPAEVTQWANNYSEIIARAAHLPKNKQWRFARDAMQQFEKAGGFLARQLTDTQYLSRMALEYMNALYPVEEPDEHGELRRRNHVRVVPGRLTELLRRNWGLNNILSDHNDFNNTGKQKNRCDHRHHAIDAAVVGVTSRSLLQRISSAAAQLENHDFENLIKHVLAKNPPWQEFRDDLKQAVSAVIVSHKADHGTVSRAGYAKGKGQTTGQLHNDTAYGLTGEKDEKGNTIVVRRKLFLSLKAKDIESIRDTDLKAELYSAVSGLKDGKEFQEALLHFQKMHKRYKGIRRVRVIESLNVIPIKNTEGQVYKGYKGDANYRYDVWKTLDNKWIGEVIPVFDIHQPGWKSEIHAKYPTAKKILSLQQDDMVAYEHPDDGYTIARVVKFNLDGRIYFAPHAEANVDQRNRNKEDPFKYFIKSPNSLKNIYCRQVRIDVIGQIFDPGLRNR